MVTKLKLMTGATAAMMLLAGCEKKVGGQVVAVVNGQEITEQELNGELQGAQIPQGADKKVVMAQLLQRVIDRKLLVQKAKEEGLDKSPAYLDQVRRGEDALIVNLMASKAAKAVPLPDAGAVNSFIASNPTLFSQRKRYTLDQISFPQPSDVKWLQKLQPAHTLEAVAATLTAEKVAFQRGSSTLDSASIPPEMAAKIASLPAGEPFLTPANGRIVASVIKGIEASPTPDAQSKPAALEMLRRKGLEEAMRKQLDAARAGAKIDYKEGYAPPPASAASPKAAPAG